MKIGYCCGVFDLGHIGHIRFLKNARKKCNRLVVGIVMDYAIQKQKGKKRPILNYAERRDWVEELGIACRIVPQATFNPSVNLIELKPQVFIKGIDQNHISDETAIKLKIPICILERTPHISTSDIIQRIKQK